MTSALDKLFLEDWQDGFKNNVLRIARQSMDSRGGLWHPLGFIVLPLTETSNFKYRLHISSPEHRNLQMPHWPIHDHSYNFESIVLAGRVDNRIYSAELNPEGPDKFDKIYRVEYDENESVMRSTNITAKLTETFFETIETGSRYTITAGVFHQSSQGSGTLAATLVRTVAVPQMAPRVVGDINGDAIYRFKRLPVEQEIMRKLIDAFSDKS